MLPGGEDRETEVFMRHGIAPISMWADLQQNIDNIGNDFTRGIAQKISIGPQNPEGETHSTQAFEYVYNLLNTVIADYKDCHPPYVMHITDGAANDDGDSKLAAARAEAFNRITNLRTDYGNVLMSTVYIGENLADEQSREHKGETFTQTWTGITEETVFRGPRAVWANSLRAVSSRMPLPYTEAMRAEGYSALKNSSYLFFPGNEQAMLRLAINNAASTGK
jgi:hypothetical protein